MKKLILIGLMICAAGCKNANKNLQSKMPGSYLMAYQTIKDSARTTKYTDLAQLKMYTDSFMMYVQINPTDTVSSFGVGSYRATDSGSIREHDFYSSRNANFTTTPVDFNLKISLQPDGYKQEIPQIKINGEDFHLTEVYQKVSNDQKSPLDGLWKEIQSYTVKGKDTLKNDRTQYKAFYGGYFMYGHTVKDSSGKISTGVGYGTFAPSGNNQIRELDLKSTYPIAVGETFLIDYVLDGNDHYNQTIQYPDSSISKEFYERVKL